MKFDFNEELDLKQKLECMLFKKGFSKEEKTIILDLLRKIQKDSHSSKSNWIKIIYEHL